MDSAGESRSINQNSLPALGQTMTGLFFATSRQGLFREGFSGHRAHPLPHLLHPVRIDLVEDLAEAPAVIEERRLNDARAERADFYAMAGRLHAQGLAEADDRMLRG